MTEMYLMRDVIAVVSQNYEVVNSEQKTVYDVFGREKMKEFMEAGWINRDAVNLLKERRYSILQANYKPFTERRDRYKHYYFHFQIVVKNNVFTLKIGMMHTGHAEHPAFYAKMKARGEINRLQLKNYGIVKDKTNIIFLQKKDDVGNDYTNEAILERLNKSMHAHIINETAFYLGDSISEKIFLPQDSLMMNISKGLGFIRMLFLGEDCEDYLEAKKEERDEIFLGYVVNL